MNDKEAAKAVFEEAVSKGLDAGLVSCVWFGMVSRKKVAVLLDFVQMRGGGPAQIFCPLFTNCIYWVNLGMGREGEGGGGETPAQIFCCPD